MFCARPGMSFAPRTINAAPTMTRAITIHIVSRVLLIAGWKVTSSLAAGALSGAKSTTLWGAGNSREPVMKQTGKAQGSPGFSLFGGGNAMNARASTRMTPRINATQREETRRPRLGSGASP
jgi:hypothetical protein